MEAQLEKIKEVQKAAWNKSSAGWKKWDALMMQFLRPMNDEMIRMLRLKGNEHVLDAATGTGEPGISIAALLHTGKVTGVDLSENMVAIANEHALEKGIHNYHAVCGDISELPFPGKTFDAVSCRLSFMFFPDMQISLKEMLRVLKPGGRICASFWNGPDGNSWVSDTMNVMIRRLNLNPPVAGGPGLYRCAEPGMMKSLFTDAGLNGIEEKTTTGILPCNSIDTYWNFITEVASPLAFSSADDETRARIKEEVMKCIKAKCPDGNAHLRSSATVICGQKK